MKKRRKTTQKRKWPKGMKRRLALLKSSQELGHVIKCK